MPRFEVSTQGAAGRRRRSTVAGLAAVGLLLPLGVASGLPWASAGAGSGSESAGTTSAAGTTTHAAAAFDLDTGNAPTELIIPAVIDATLASVSPSASDASLVLRLTLLVTTGWFDAIAPYHPTAVGVYSDLGRRPAEEATDHARNVAMLYASAQVMNSLLPQHAQDWRAMVQAGGLDPDDDSTDPTTAVGIGNLAGAAVVAARERDGMNQLGDEPGSMAPGQPYADTTGYAPVNTHADLKDPSRWQPLVVTDGSGIFRAQTFVTPQWSKVKALSYDDVAAFTTPTPRASIARGRPGPDGYKGQLDEVLAVSAALTDEQKLAAELFDNKFLSLGFSALFVLQSHALTLEEFVHYDFLVNVAAGDAGIAIWKEKIRHDAVRPTTAIRHQYGGKNGDGQLPTGGPANAWTSYLATADHPEYPSGSAGFCAAHAQASRQFLGTDEFGWQVVFPAGSSRVEPGVVPAQETTLSFPTWTEFERLCGLSRLYGGVHFRPAIDEAQTMTRPIGDLAHAFVQRHIDGSAG